MLRHASLSLCECLSLLVLVIAVPQGLAAGEVGANSGKEQVRLQSGFEQERLRRYRISYGITQGPIKSQNEVRRHEIEGDLVVIDKKVADGEMIREVRFMEVKVADYIGAKKVDQSEGVRQTIKSILDTRVEVRETPEGIVKSVRCLSKEENAAVAQLYTRYCRLEFPSCAVGMLDAWDITDPAAKQVSGSIQVVRYVVEELELKNGVPVSVTIDGTRAEILDRSAAPDLGEKGGDNEELTGHGGVVTSFCARDMAKVSVAGGTIIERAFNSHDVFTVPRAERMEGSIHVRVKLVSTEKVKAEEVKDANEADGAGK